MLLLHSFVTRGVSLRTLAALCCCSFLSVDLTKICTGTVLLVYERFGPYLKNPFMMNCCCCTEIASDAGNLHAFIRSLSFEGFVSVDKS